MRALGSSVRHSSTRLSVVMKRWRNLPALPVPISWEMENHERVVVPIKG